MEANEALAWIMYRDQGFAAKVRGQSALKFAVQVAARTMDGIDPQKSHDAALRSLLGRCASARINTTGIPCRAVWNGSLQFVVVGSRVPVKAHTWPDLHIFDLHGKSAVEPKPGSPAEDRYLEPLFRRVDVLRCYPANSLQVRDDREEKAPAAPPVPKPPRAPRDRGIAGALRAFSDLWPDGRLPPVELSATQRDEKINAWLVDHDMLPIKRSTVQRAIKKRLAEQT